MKNIGLFGGTFDPVHEGHIHIAEVFTSQFELDLCIFVPANISPFKIKNKDAMYSAAERLSLLKIKTEKNSKFYISEHEITSGGISYTIDTVTHFYDLYPNSNLFLLIGTDQAIKFNMWKDYEKILKLVTVVIAKRQPLPTQEEIIYINNIFNNKAKWLDNKIIPVSSTEIRKLNKKYS